MLTEAVVNIIIKPCKTYLSTLNEKFLNFRSVNYEKEIIIFTISKMHYL